MTEGRAAGSARSSAAFGLYKTRLSCVERLAWSYLACVAGVAGHDSVFGTPGNAPKLEPLIDTGCRAGRLVQTRPERALGRE